eukprot:scaffold14722_cov32-Tisochrysis_lutea.AAC.1
MLINAGHAALYGALFFMPLSGFAMGYYGGKGVPFYGLFTIPGKTEGRTPEDGELLLFTAQPTPVAPLLVATCSGLCRHVFACSQPPLPTLSLETTALSVLCCR